MSKVRICFLGTPEFAVTCLNKILEDSHYEVVGVVTQPDRPAGRKLQLTPSPVKVFAMAHGLEVISPESLKMDLSAMEKIRSWRAEVAVVVAYGQILTEDFLNSFSLGCLNVHASILPRWRGAAPIQRVIEFGDEETGVALQKMVKKLDAGDVLGIRRIKIGEMDSKQLHDQLALMGAELLSVEMMDYVRGNLVGQHQDGSLVTYAKKIEKEESRLDWNLSAQQLNRKIRAFVWGPGAYTTYQGSKIKIHKTFVEEASSSKKPGTIVGISNECISVATGRGLLNILELQPDSKKRMTVSDFLKGHVVKVEERFE